MRLRNPNKTRNFVTESGKVELGKKRSATTLGKLKFLRFCLECLDPKSRRIK
jgi:hypothetical protein